MQFLGFFLDGWGEWMVSYFVDFFLEGRGGGRG